MEHISGTHCSDYYYTKKITPQQEEKSAWALHAPEMKPVKDRFSPQVLRTNKMKYFSVYPSLYWEDQLSEEEIEKNTSQLPSA